MELKLQRQEETISIKVESLNSKDVLKELFGTHFEKLEEWFFDDHELFGLLQKFPETKENVDEFVETLENAD